MSVSRVYDELVRGIEGTVKRDEPMSRHTTYRVGGPASLFVTPDSVSDLSLVVDLLAEESIPYTVLGRGSNVLVSDRGYDGAVIVLGSGFRRHEVAEDGRVHTGAGAPLAAVVQDAFAVGLTGLEFAVGIPGTVGGALAMNAGSRDEWMGGVVESLTLYSQGTGLQALRGGEVRWGYRATDVPAKGIIVESVIRLNHGDKSLIRNRMEASLKRRRTSQPMGAACAGSVFVNPANDSAGRLIEAAGLKGFRVGGAFVSDIHANFIVNDGGAMASDVVGVMRAVCDGVRDAYGIELRPEIRFLGSFDEA